jgi:hypothetical protein
VRRPTAVSRAFPNQDSRLPRGLVQRKGTPNCTATPPRSTHNHTQAPTFCPPSAHTSRTSLIRLALYISSGSYAHSTRPNTSTLTDRLRNTTHNSSLNTHDIMAESASPIGIANVCISLRTTMFTSANKHRSCPTSGTSSASANIHAPHSNLTLDRHKIVAKRGAAFTIMVRIAYYRRHGHALTVAGGGRVRPRKDDVHQHPLLHHD